MERILIVSCCLFVYIFNGFAQNIENKDSVSRQLESEQIIIPTQMQNGFFLRRLILSEKMPIMQYVQFATSFNQDVASEVIQFDQTIISPYSYSLNTLTESLVIKGIKGHITISDFLSAKVDVSLSKLSFITPTYPLSYINGAIRTELIFKLHDRIQLVGLGQISLREGIDPKIPSLMSGANYYGAGLQFKITNKVGIGVGVTNSFFRGEWTKGSYIAPVEY